MATRVPRLLCEIKKHPFISCSFLLLFTPPVFPVVIFFSPLILSTALCALALVSFTAHFAPASAASSYQQQQQHKQSPQEGEAAGLIKAPPPSPPDSLDAVIRACREETTWLEWLVGQHQPHLHRPFGTESCEDGMPLGASIEHSHGDMGMFVPPLLDVLADEKDREGDGAQGNFHEGLEREANAEREAMRLCSAVQCGTGCGDTEEICEGAHESPEGNAERGTGWDGSEETHEDVHASAESNVGSPATPHEEEAQDHSAASLESKKEHPKKKEEGEEAEDPRKKREGERAEDTGLRFSFFAKGVHAVLQAAQGA